MYIIFGADKAEALREDEKYIVLELDTVKMPDESIMTAFCVVEKVPLGELSQVPAHQTWHAEMLNDYRAKNWDQCIRSIDMLMGHFNGELDSFYKILRARVEKFKVEGPGPNWSGVYEPGSVTV